MRVLVLGAYGLAGREIVRALLRVPGCAVVASGRRRDRLDQQFARSANGLATLLLDATDEPQLRRACESADLVVNAVGPFARGGAEIARTVIDCGRHYVDCANEQIHYQRLEKLDDAARSAGALLATGAGLFPGLSTLLAMQLLERDERADGIEITYAQLRHAYADGGKASELGGVLDAVYRPVAVRDGARVPVLLGHSTRRAELPSPLGTRFLLEVPTIDVLVLAPNPALREIHTWVHLGDHPSWLFGLIRLLNPVERPWAYRLIERIVERLDRAQAEKARSENLGTDAMVMVETSHCGAARRCAVAHFTDGAAPTAVLPARIARDLESGAIERRGLTTPADLYRWEDVEDDLRPCLLKEVR